MPIANSSTNVTLSKAKSPKKRPWRHYFTYNELEENDVELKKLQGWLEKDEEELRFLWWRDWWQATHHMKG